jgi:hypothetical protein
MLAFTILHRSVELHTKRLLLRPLQLANAEQTSVFFRSGRSSSSSTRKFPGLVPRIECLMSIETRSFQASSAEKNGTRRDRSSELSLCENSAKVVTEISDDFLRRCDNFVTTQV